jgi:hypothetical protein
MGAAARAAARNDRTNHVPANAASVADSSRSHDDPCSCRVGKVQEMDESLALHAERVNNPE